MKKYIYLFSLLLLANYFPVMAQSSISNVLKSIEANNKALQAGKQLYETQKLEARTGNALPNPTVELNQLWADRSVGEM